MEHYEELKIKSVETLTITPTIADAMLKKNHGNRKLSPGTVNTYACEMLAGKWKSTHQGIAIDEHGNIVDGQHRLSAIVRSKIPIVTTLTIYKGAIDTMLLPIDRGKNRLTQDLTGLCSSELSIYNAIIKLYPTVKTGRYSDKIDPVDALTMSKKSQDELAALSKLAGISCMKSSWGTKSFGLERLWKGPFKAACIAALFEGIDIEYPIKQLKKGEEAPREYALFHDWHSEVGIYASGRTFIVILLPMAWNILKYRKFIDHKQDEKLDANRSELRKIFKRKFPEVLDK